MERKTMLVVSIFVILMLAQTVSAESWKFVARDRDMKIGENFTTSEGYRLQMSDISTSDEKSVLFDMFSGEVKQKTIICYVGQTEEIFDENYKVTLVSIVKGKPHCILYKKNVPVFEITSETTQGDENKTVIYTKLTELPATNVKVTWEISGEHVKKPASKTYGALEQDTEKRITIYWSGEAEILMKITYKDADGEAYTQVFDVVNNAVVKQEVEEVKEDKASTVKPSVISESRQTTEKALLKKAITRALKYIDFSVETEADLNRILSEI